MNLLLLANTVRYLRYRQLLGQALVRLRPLWENTETFAHQDCPPFPGCQWPSSMKPLPPGAQTNTRRDLRQGGFRFLNVSHNLGWPPAWEPAGTTRLWLYNLHYFEWLWALDYGDARDVAENWINAHALQKGRVGWEPYPISLRLLNWCLVFFGKFRGDTESEPLFRDLLWRGIYLQAEWLARHLETHLMGNHLLENAAALVLAGSCFEGDAADNWYRRGERFLDAELTEQMLPDGLHFERSPMYHLRVCYLLALLSRAGRTEIRDRIRVPLARALNAAAAVCHPDGQIALLNDSAFAIYNTLDELRKSVTSHPSDPSHLSDQETIASSRGPWALPAAGYYGRRTPDASYIVCDAGDIGPDYIPGHAHADVFSFELSLRGHRVVVDSGVCDYEPSETRRYCRSTRAHNTVEIDGRDQCELWGAFRVGRRGHPHDVLWKPDTTGFQLEGWYDGIGGRSRHFRKFTWQDPGRLEIQDKVYSLRPVECVARIHLHPSCRVEQIAETSAVIAYAAGRFSVRSSGAASLACRDSLYCPEFGVTIQNKVLEFHARGKNAEILVTIEAL